MCQVDADLSAQGDSLEVTMMASWGFLTNHALVLAFISGRPESTGLQIAQAVGITERATRKIVADLHAAGYIETERVGRHNRYHVDGSRPMARIGDRQLTVGQLLGLVLDRESRAPVAG